MKIYVKNKVMSLARGSSVLNEDKQPAFQVKGKTFSITRKKKIKDLSGQLLYSVRNKWFNFFVHRAYVYDQNKKKIATVKSKFFQVRQFIVLGYQDEIKIDGDFFSLTSQILRNGEVIGTIRRQFTVVADAFEIEADEKEMPFILALVIAIDNICDKRSK